MEWFKITNEDEVASPALLVYPGRIEENIQRMLAIAGGPERLRPHIKTNKMPEIVRLMLAAGIRKFKCATLAEAALATRAGAADVLLAYQPVGPNVRKFAELARAFPKAKFSTIADNPASLRALSEEAAHAGITVEVLLDIDCGQHRTGIVPGLGALELYRFLITLPGLKAGGLHVYDGHIHDSDPAARAAACESAFIPAQALRDEVLKAGLPVPCVVAGGTPTFPLHARRGNVECSPGTCVFWDHGYGTKFPDLGFVPAALVFTRVISKPMANRLCLDLGYKALAAEMPHPRVHFLNLPEAKAVAHNEEHLVLETDQAAAFPVGTALYGVPWHICPTVNLHAEAAVVREGRVTERWHVAACERQTGS